MLQFVCLHFNLFLFRFQKACIQYGVADVDLFQTTDLWDLKNVALVTQTVFAVARSVRYRPDPDKLYIYII